MVYLKGDIKPRVVYSLGEYHPYWGRDDVGNKSRNSKFDAHSAKILDLKKNDAAAVKTFFTRINPHIAPGVAIAVVPSHEAGKATPSGMRSLATKLAASGRLDATSCLRRHTTVEKLASGGDRSVGVHLKSIDVIDVEFVKGKEVLLIDDVTTSGNSLAACMKLLFDAGAKEVFMLAIGRTTH